MYIESEQLDFWPQNVIHVDFRNRYAYECSPPLTNSERIINDWFVASKKARDSRLKHYQEWKEFLYSIRCMVGQLRLRVYKKGEYIIVERIPYRGEALREKVVKHRLRVAK